MNVTCLNPCSNGICSKSLFGRKGGALCQEVLILVLMEYALREEVLMCATLTLPSLNPCSNGICSKSL